MTDSTLGLFTHHQHKCCVKMLPLWCPQVWWLIFIVSLIRLRNREGIIMLGCAWEGVSRDGWQREENIPCMLGAASHRWDLVGNTNRKRRKQAEWQQSLCFLFWWKVESSFPIMQTEAGPTPMPSLPCWFTPIHNALFWSPLAPRTHMANRYTCSQNTYT